MSRPTCINRRILLVDDTPAIHRDFQRILGAAADNAAALSAAEATLFGIAPARRLEFELESAYQGEEALALVKTAQEAQQPYALAFIDMRMPPGWDGLETIERLWLIDPRLQVALCTAYSDYSWEEMAERLDLGDRLLILKKPFDAIEIRQMADALTMKWQMTQDAALKLEALEQAVDARTAELQAANRELSEEVRLRQQSERRLRTYGEVINSTDEGVLIASADHIVVDVNQAYLRITGLTRDEVVGAKLLAQSTLPAGAQAEVDWRAKLDQQGSWQGELLLTRKGGESVPCLVCLNAVSEEQGASARHLVSICHDISELRRHEKLLEHQATHAALTGLPNRALLLDRMSWSIERAIREQTRLAVVFIDLDKFKDINDSLGHGVGDLLLISIAERLADCTRTSETLAHLGGDEFVILADPVEDEHGLFQLAERVLVTLAQPLQLAGETQRVSCSLGISICPEDGTDVEILMKNADIAMHRAKEAGRNNFQFFKPQMQTRLCERIYLEQQLRRALERDELLLHYQPQVDLRSGEIIGLEALIRWNSPELGLVPPARFIPLAEESKLILDIGAWVLAKACSSIRDWRRAGLPVVPVAINVSAVQFVQQGFEQQVQQALQTSGIDARDLELELTESLSMVDPETSISVMRCLKELGVSLSIDDFGTGYSNLSYLKRFPVDKLKIDRTFVEGLTSESGGLAIPAAVIGLAHALGLRVIAEGVETQSQVQQLAMLGCDEIQGYYFSKPLAEADLRQLISRDSRLDLTTINRQPYSRTVLLIDDDQGVLSSIRRLLHGQAVQLLTANSTQLAYQLLARHEVGVIISDHEMRGQDGVSFLAQVKHMYPRAVRILISGHSRSELFTSAINKSEVFRFIHKPWDNAALLESLNDALKRYEQHA